MVSLSVKGISETLGTLIDLPKQVRYASSQAINDVALEVQKEEVEKTLPGHLTLRSKGAPWQRPGTRYGVNIRPFARKDSLRAVVGSQADWLKLVEEGGTKQRATELAIPTTFWKQKQEILKRARKPRALLAAKRKLAELGGRAFLYRGAKMPQGIWARTTKAAYPIRLLFTFKTRATIRAVLVFFGTGRAKVMAIYPQRFQARLARAIATARPKKT